MVTGRGSNTLWRSKLPEQLGGMVVVFSAGAQGLQGPITPATPTMLSIPPISWVPMPLGLSAPPHTPQAEGPWVNVWTHAPWPLFSCICKYFAGDVLLS